ncbi:hypothetical protein KQS06HV_91686 [Klebsiella quasipneumoniae subsp. similipneumoniae]|nr:hypothetical protein KQS06HV_91686 [Klebsiella quasipneumoniae subsp. similipneumoniae]
MRCAGANLSSRSNPRHLFRLFALRRCGFASNAGIFPFKTILQLYFNKFNPVPGTHREDGTKTAGLIGNHHNKQRTTSRHLRVLYEEDDSGSLFTRGNEQHGQCVCCSAAEHSHWH